MLSSESHIASSFALKPSQLPNEGKQNIIRSFLKAEMVQKAWCHRDTLPSSDINGIKIQIELSSP
jgi:hypothetical protein